MIYGSNVSGKPTSASANEGNRAPKGVAGDDYRPLLLEQLSEERDRKKSLEERGIAVVTTSGVLVSLLFGLGAVVTSVVSFRAPRASLYLLAAGVVLFTLAAAAGIATNWPRYYPEGGSEELLRLTEPQHWHATREHSGRRAAELWGGILKEHRAVNGAKATALKWAMTLELGATAAVATGIVVTIIER